MTIKFLITGGTIDKRYNELNGDLVFTQSCVGDMLKQGRVTADVSLETVMLKDSLDMGDEDRRTILHACLAADEPHIVITHGTDTMVETARVLADAIHDKTIVLLGAMIPYVFEYSDALFNLGCAVSAVQTLGTGVYITMNGNVFDHGKVTKNTAVGQFQNI